MAKYWLAIILILLLPLAYAITVNEESTIRIGLDYLNGTGGIGGCSLDFTVYYNNGTEYEKYGSTEEVQGVYYNDTVTINQNGFYWVYANCTKSGNFYTSEISFNADGGGNMGIIATIIVLPVILGIILLIASLGMKAEDHNILKIFTFLASIVLFWVSLNLGTTAVLEFYTFTEFSDLIAQTVKWTGWIFWTITVYFFIYYLYKIVQVMAQKKKERLEY